MTMNEQQHASKEELANEPAVVVAVEESTPPPDSMTPTQAPVEPPIPSPPYQSRWPTWWRVLKSIVIASIVYVIIFGVANAFIVYSDMRASIHLTNTSRVYATRSAWNEYENTEQYYMDQSEHARPETSADEPMVETCSVEIWDGRNGRREVVLTAHRASSVCDGLERAQEKLLYELRILRLAQTQESALESPVVICADGHDLTLQDLQRGFCRTPVAQGRGEYQMRMRVLRRSTDF